MGFDLDGFAVRIAATTADGAPIRVAAFDGDIIQGKCFFNVYVVNVPIVAVMSSVFEG